MGFINNPVKLNELFSRFNIKNYIETGVGRGDSMNHVLSMGYIERAYGIEIDQRLYDSYSEIFGDKPVEFFYGYSHEEMPKLVKKLNGNPSLFWLDAHFPGCYFSEGFDEPDLTKRLPLEEELITISQYRDISNDVIIMDDLRMYVDRNFSDGNWDKRETLGGNGYQFVVDILEKTHVIKEHYGDQGYILAFPIKFSEKEILDIIK
jgi:hypothetical protein